MTRAMPGTVFGLIAAAAIAVPGAAWAGQAPARTPVYVLVPVAVPMPAPMPMAMPMVQPAALFREAAAMQFRMQDQLRQMQKTMAALQLMALRGVPVPIPAGGNGVTMVSMVSTGGPGGVCTERMEVVPQPDGRMRVTVQRSGKDCPNLPASMPSARAASHRHLPSDVIPPPSGLTFARYPVAATAPIQQG